MSSSESVNESVSFQRLQRTLQNCRRHVTFLKIDQKDEEIWHDQQEGKDRDKYKDFLTRLTFPDRSRNSKQ